MLTTAAVITGQAGKLIFIGFCLSIGFWAGRKATNKIDEMLFRYDKRKMAELQAEMQGQTA